MFINDWKKEFFTIPNLLSLLRIGLIPVYCSIYLGAENTTAHLWAAGILTISCLTDMIDGQIARQFHMESAIGRILDPLADKLTQLTLCLCLRIRFPELNLILILLLIKELLQTGVSLLLIRGGKSLPGALMAGKVSTTVLFISFIVIVLLPQPSRALVKAFVMVDGIFLIHAFIQYAYAFFANNSWLQEFRE